MHVTALNSTELSHPDWILKTVAECEITILLPCLNEAATLGPCIREGLHGLQSVNVLGEILVADNGSTDESRNIARALGARVIEVHEKGYGSALKSGIKAAKGKFIIIADSDLSYDLTELSRYVEGLQNGWDLVIGCRLPSGRGTIHPGAMPFLHRWVGNPVLSALGRVFFNSNIHDFHCGIRAFQRDKILGLNLTTPGMEFSSEMIVKAHLAGLSISEVPATLRKDGRTRSPHLRTWRDGWRHLRFMLLYAPNWLFLYPGLGIFLMSLSVFLFLLRDPLVVGNIKFDTNTLLAAGMGILVGVQIISLATFINVYTRGHGLLPPDSFYQKLAKSRPFESGLAVGFSVGILGTIYLVRAFLEWKAVGFGDLPYSQGLRLIIPSVVLIALAPQAAFTGFVLAVLGIHTPPNEKVWHNKN